MATFEQLKKRFEYLVDEATTDLDPDEVIMLFNECQEDLSEVAGYAKTAEASYYKNDSIISIPIDLVSLAEIKIKPSNKTEYTRMVSIGLTQPSDVFDNRLRENNGLFVYEWFGDNIEIRPTPKEDGTLQIRYYAKLPDLKETKDFTNGSTNTQFLGQIPSLRLQYHKLLPLYAAAKHMQNYMDELSAKSDYYGEYMQGKAELEQDTLKRKNKSRSRTVTRHNDFI